MCDCRCLGHAWIMAASLSSTAPSYTGRSWLHAGDPMSIALSRRVTHRNIGFVLIAGFTLVTLLLLAAAGVAVRNNRDVQADAAELIREQGLTARLMNQMRV